MKNRWAYFVLVFFATTGSVLALQQAAASQQKNQPTYHLTIVPGTITAINYQNRKSTEIGFQGSPLPPLAVGQATVISEHGGNRDRCRVQESRTGGVEIIISGEIIGTQIGHANPTAQQ